MQGMGPLLLLPLSSCQISEPFHDPQVDTYSFGTLMCTTAEAMDLGDPRRTTPKYPPGSIDHRLVPAHATMAFPERMLAHHCQARLGSDRPSMDEVLHRLAGSLRQLAEMVGGSHGHMQQYCSQCRLLHIKSGSAVSGQPMACCTFFAFPPPLAVQLKALGSLVQFWH